MAKQIVKQQHQRTNDRKPVKSDHRKSESKKVKWEFPLEKRNLMIIGIGAGVIILGYLLMATGISNEPAVPDGRWNNIFAVYIAPVVLVIGYCVIVPYGLSKLFKKTDEVSEAK